MTEVDVPNLNHALDCSLSQLANGAPRIPSTPVAPRRPLSPLTTLRAISRRLLSLALPPPRSKRPRGPSEGPSLRGQRPPRDSRRVVEYPTAPFQDPLPRARGGARRSAAEGFHPGPRLSFPFPCVLRACAIRRGAWRGRPHPGVPFAHSLCPASLARYDAHRESTRMCFIAHHLCRGAARHK